MNEAFNIVITEIEDVIQLHLDVKRNFPNVYMTKAGSIKVGHFITAYGIAEAQRYHKILTNSGAKVKIEAL